MMSLSENLKVLRKQKGLSQEQLAEQLNVSRQAVSKWESNNGMPEMDSLIILSEIFECTIDDLLKKDLTDHDPTVKQIYEKHYDLIAKAYSFGIVSILSGVCVYLFTEIYFPENTKYEFIPQILFLFFVLIGVISFVYFGMIDSHFEERKIEFDDFYSENERVSFNQTYSLAIAVGVGLILFGVVVQVLVDNIYNESLANGLFMIFVTMATGIFVYFGVLKSKYDRVDRNKIIEEGKNKKVFMYCGIIMMIITIIYLWWSFMTNAWRVSWIVYPIGGIVCGIVWLIFEGKEE
ncbi:HTH-type transcriptional regulator ImmR [Thomasclavelia cocleata]|uniref:HTH-type transcriptional regulator ImmR n=2 Tax=Thomasclavelia cocleata TaxID=69824 RepID=A0A829ZA09_9FIRM|nr:HTH-type transcriptional regulator ImmR [Thomasclavelia cocleata]